MRRAFAGATLFAGCRREAGLEGHRARMCFISDPTQKRLCPRRSGRRPRRLGPGPPFFKNDCGHGRAEYRELTAAAVTPEQIGFPFAAQALALRAVVTKKKTGEASDETRLYATSLLSAERRPPQLMRMCRGHRGVEAGNHDRRDVTWGEDRESGRNAKRALNIALVRTALLGPLLSEGPVNLRALSQTYSVNPGAALRRLLHPHFEG